MSTRSQVVELLGESAPKLDRRIEAGDLVAIDTDRTLFPAWQFHSNGTLAAGVAELMAFLGDAVALTEWMTTSNCEFGDRPPARALATEPEATIHIAAICTAASW